MVSLDSSGLAHGGAVAEEQGNQVQLGGPLGVADQTLPALRANIGAECVSQSPFHISVSA